MTVLQVTAYLITPLQFPPAFYFEFRELRVGGNDVFTSLVSALYEMVVLLSPWVMMDRIQLS
jgi:hypothetical protein